MEGVVESMEREKKWEEEKWEEKTGMMHGGKAQGKSNAC